MNENKRENTSLLIKSVKKRKASNSNESKNAQKKKKGEETNNKKVATETDPLILASEIDTERFKMNKSRKIKLSSSGGKKLSIKLSKKTNCNTFFFIHFFPN